jgi:hypothetical protein
MSPNMFDGIGCFIVFVGFVLVGIGFTISYFIFS